MQYPCSEPRTLNRIDNGDFPWRAFPQPQIIGEYSVDGAREVVFDRSQLQIFKPVSAQSVRFDLNDGLRERVPKMDKFEGLDNMLKWILHTREQTREDLKSDFVCYRGALCTLMRTPYEQAEGWLIKVVKFNGTVYMMQVDTEEQGRRRMQQQESERDQKFTAWGYKFEQFMSLQDNSIPVDENEEFCCVYRTKIGRYSFLIKAEMDGYKAQDKESLNNNKLDANLFVEYKTSRKVEYKGQEMTLKRSKMRRWWTQSFVVGIKEVVVGWRSDAGIVEQVETIPVSSLPRIGMDWKPNVCANFLLLFTSFVQKELLRDSEDQVYNVNWDPRNGFRVEKDSEQFLPSWFLAEFK